MKYHSIDNLYMVALRGTTFAQLLGWREAMGEISVQEVNDATILFWHDSDPFAAFRKLEALLPEGSFLYGTGLARPTVKYSRYRDNKDVEHWLQEHDVQ